MNPATLVYLPPDLPKFNTQSFIRNIEENPPAGKLIVFSDHDYKIDGLIKIKSPDEAMKKAMVGENRKVDVPNLVWLTAIRIAKSAGLTHMLFLESDCRLFGAGWDVKLFNEFFDDLTAPMFGGSIVAYNVACDGRAAYDRYVRFVNQNRKNPFPIPPYGWKGAGDRVNPCVYPNGAGTICSIAALETLFTADELAASVKTARAIAPFDQEVGFRLWKLFGLETYNLLLHMKSQYSGFGEVMTTEMERRELLQSGTVSLVHQIKSDWLPIQK